MPFETQYDFENINSFKILCYSIFLKDLIERILPNKKRIFIVRKKT
jgi:hypothetical protein